MKMIVIGAGIGGLTFVAAMRCFLPKAQLESRNAAKQFHTTSRFQQFMRNTGFWFGNFFIKLFSRK